LASPDAADAISVSFAFPVARRDPVTTVKRVAYSSGNTSWMGA